MLIFSHVLTLKIPITKKNLKSYYFSYLCTMRKNKQPEIIEDVTIIDAGAEGMSVAKPNDKVVFIPFGAPDDIVDLQVFKRGRIITKVRLSTSKGIRQKDRTYMQPFHVMRRLQMATFGL